MSTTGQSLLKGILAVLFAFALLVTVTVLGTFWAVRHYARIEVHTPLGDLEIQKPEEVARKLDLPIYPGAVASEKGVSLRIFDDEGAADILVSKFRTRDSLAQVDTWYRGKLGTEFKREEGQMFGHRREGVAFSARRPAGREASPYNPNTATWRSSCSDSPSKVTRI